MKKKKSLVRGLIMGLGFLVSSSLALIAGLSHTDVPTIETHAANKTYSITQQQLANLGNEYGNPTDPDVSKAQTGYNWSILKWVSSGGYIECGNQWIEGGISVQNNDIFDAKVATAKFNCVQCASGAQIGVMWGASTSLMVWKNITTGNNTITWNLTGTPQNQVLFRFTYNATTPTRIKGFDASTTPIFSVECREELAVNVTKGAGIQDIWLSTSAEGFNLKANGSGFAPNSWVRVYVTLKQGYSGDEFHKMPEGVWPNSTTPLYRVDDLETKIDASHTNLGTAAAEPIEVYIAKDGNGLEDYDDYDTLVYDQAGTVSAPTRPGYTFVSWNTKADGSGTSYGTSLTKTQVNSIILGTTPYSTITFYAQWTVNQYHITISPNGGTGGPDPTSFDINYDAPSPTLSPAPTRDGYIFRGYRWMDSSWDWHDAYDEDGNPLSATWNIPANATLVAKWEGIPYSVLAEAGEGVSSVFLSDEYNGSSGDASGTKYPCGSNVYCFAVLERGYRPASWSWTKISGDDEVGGAVYRVAGSEVEYLDGSTNFGTINATIGTYSVTINNNTGVKNVYVSTADGVSTPVDSENLKPNGTQFEYLSDVYAYARLKVGYEPLEGWVLIAGEAAQEDSLYRIGVIEDLDVTGHNFGEIVAQPKTYPVNLDGYNGDDYNATYDATMPNIAPEDFPVRPGYTFTGYYDDETGGNQYINENGEGVRPWENNDSTITLYPHWTKDMIYTSSGYQADYDGLPHTIKVDVTDPEGATIMYGTTEGVYDLAEAPTYTNVGEYTVYFQVTAFIDDVEYTTINGQHIVKIDMVDRTALEDALDKTKDWLDDMDDNNPTLAGELRPYYDAACGVAGDPNKTADELADALEALLDGLDEKASDFTEWSIDQLEPVEFTSDFKDKLDDAADRYNALDDGQKALVDPDHQKKLEDALAAYDAMDKINAIGDPELTPESKGLIDDARDAFDALTDDQKALVDDGFEDTLIDDEKAYEAMDKIADALPIIYGPECEAALDDARDYYDGLTPEQKAMVDNYGDLTKGETDYAAISDLVLDIETLDHIDYDPADLAEIEALRDRYEHLTDDQKNGFPDDTLQHLADLEEAFAVLDDIHAIGDPELTPESKALIDEARKNYDALTEGGKALVNPEDLQILIDAEKVYEVKDLIDQIGEVSLTEDVKEAIEEARAHFDALTEEQKKGISESDLKTLIDAEKVYETLRLIDDIGNVDYSTESKDKIDAARDYYDALSEDQKAMVGKLSIDNLVASEKTYADLHQNATVTVIILLILVVIALGGGIYWLYRLKGKEWIAKIKGDKAMSISALPLVMLISHYADPAFIILYILIGLTLIVYGFDLYFFFKKKDIHPIQSCLAFFKKKFGKKEEEAVTAPAVAPEVAPSEEEEEEVLVKDDKGNIFRIRYERSFTAKMCQADDTLKAYYRGLKNHVLSYKKANSRISWGFDTVNLGRERVLKFAVRGKTLCVYLALEADKLDAKYKVEKIETKKHAETPCLYRIKNDRRYNYAKQLIDMIMGRIGAVMGEPLDNDYPFPYESTEALVKKGLIKERKLPVEASVQEQAPAVEEEEEVIVKDDKGNVFRIQYERSFTAKMCQSSDELKAYYRQIKNHVLSYKKANSRISWGFDSINLGREKILKFAVRGKTLCVYLALNPDDLADSKYKVEKVESKKYEDVPCLYRIKNDRRCNYAKQLIDMIMGRIEAVKGEEKNDDYPFPYETTEALVEKGLIKERKVPMSSVSFLQGFKIQFERSFTAKMCQAPEELKAYYRVLKNHVLSYKKANSRISWGFDSVNLGREKILKFAVRGKTLCVYLNLDADQLEPKYKVEKIETKKHADTPCLYRIKNDRRCNYAKQLIDMIMERIGAVLGEAKDDDYPFPYESTEALLEKGLIKERK